jgi:pilus assembly protein CpaB
LLLQVSNRPQDTNTTFTTGGDVSRFQRRSVPARTAPSGDQGADSVAKFANALMGRGGAAAGVPNGPVVRVARGNNVTYVPVGAR